MHRSAKYPTHHLFHHPVIAIAAIKIPLKLLREQELADEVAGADLTGAQLGFQHRITVHFEGVKVDLTVGLLNHSIGGCRIPHQASGVDLAGAFLTGGQKAADTSAVGEWLGGQNGQGHRGEKSSRRATYKFFQALFKRFVELSDNLTMRNIAQLMAADPVPGCSCVAAWKTGLLLQPHKSGPIPGCELQHGGWPGHARHGVLGVITVSPHPEGVAKFVQGRGLDGVRSLPRADAHQYPRLDFGGVAWLVRRQS